MASISTESVIGAAGNLLRPAGSFLDLTDTRVREAGSSHRGESNEHRTKFRAAKWNVGTLKRRGLEVI